MTNLKNKLAITLLIVFTAIFFWNSLDAAELKLVKQIGGDDEDYFFIQVTGTVLSKQKDIFVIDSRGKFIAKYDWNGKLIKKVGQHGQGPNDFAAPVELDLFQDKLYIWDVRNSRIAVTGLNLEKISYYKIHSGLPFAGRMIVIGEKKCIGASASYSLDYRKEFKLIKILNFETQASEMFFGEVPHPEFKKSKIVKSFRNYIFSIFPILGVDRAEKKLIIAFPYPNEPVDFYEYSYSGECLDKFSISYEPGYKYPDYLLEGKLPPKGQRAVFLNSIHVYKNNILVFMGKVTYKGGMNIDKDNYCLIIDKKSKLLKSKIKVPDFLLAYHVTDEGYVLGTQTFQDTPSVFIYKIEI